MSALIAHAKSTEYCLPLQASILGPLDNVCVLCGHAYIDLLLSIVIHVKVILSPQTFEKLSELLRSSTEFKED